MLDLALGLVLMSLAQDASRTNLDETDIRNWTPDIDSKWGNPTWRRFGEEKVRDDRFLDIDHGPLYSATIRVLDEDDRQRARAHKGIAVRLGGQGDMPKAMLVWDRNLLQCQGGWIGDWLEHSDSRFGLMDVPANAAEPVFWASPTQSWRRPDVELAERASWCFPLPEATGRWGSVHLHGDDIVLEYTVFGTRVLEHPTLERIDGEWELVRRLEIGPDDQPLDLMIAPADGVGDVSVQGDATLRQDGGWFVARIEAGATPRQITIVHGHPDAPRVDRKDLRDMLRGDRPLRWPEVIETTVENVGQGGPYVHERVVPPFENPWRSLMFLGGLDFMPDGDPVVSTLFGDVWVVSDIDSGVPSWKRFATGLYQPLGIKVVDGDIFVIERGQITKLLDHDQDGEADEYRNFSNRWHTPGDAHCYDINLERDSQGNWYILKNGAWGTPTGGCLLRIAPDGSGDAQVYATGFRHCNSMGISPTGQLATGGQQGTWQPATRLDLNREGGFYGLMEAAHRDVAMYDRPLLWMPLECDNSAGDPVWAPEGWGPLGGELLHLSWGQCWLLHILQEQVDDVPQGTAVVLGLGRTMAGPARARFSPVDGHLWMAGCMGWQTWGPWDGSLDRIRLVDDDTPLTTPMAIRTESDGIVLTFPESLDSDSVMEVENWSVKQWNYHWSPGYGSAHWSVRKHMHEGQDELGIDAVHMLDDRTVALQIADWRPAMQTRIGWSIASASGEPRAGVSWGTTHRIPRGDLPQVLDLNHDEGQVIDNGVIEMRWRGPLEDATVLVRAVPDEGGHPVGTEVDVHAPGSGDHLLRITLQDRHITAELDGVMILDHLETDTRVPLAGTTHVLGADDVVVDVRRGPIADQLLVR